MRYLVPVLSSLGKSLGRVPTRSGARACRPSVEPSRGPSQLPRLLKQELENEKPNALFVCFQKKIRIRVDHEFQTQFLAFVGLSTAYCVRANHMFRLIARNVAEVPKMMSSVGILRSASSDDQTIASTADGDPAARWSELEACRDYLRLVVRRGGWTKGGDQPATSDLVQDTLVDAWRGFARFRGVTPGELRVWLKAILVHSSLNARRQPARRHIRLGQEAEVRAGSTTSPSQAAQKNSSREELDKALAMLPERQRTVVHMRLWDQLSFARIGGRLGISEDASRMLYGRAIARLRGTVRPGHDPG
jgi:RNA polymerase sigma-70 factor, ECF subfamily